MLTYRYPMRPVRWILSRQSPAALVAARQLAEVSLAVALRLAE
jgi:hypothetical protein